jgi:thiol-disulfide isomerase/thioredoxin
MTKYASLILTALLPICLCVKHDFGGIDQTRTLLNKKFPGFSGYMLNDSVVDETFLSNKIVLLNFMFIGCKGCMEELPILADLNDQYKDPGFMIVTIMGNGIEDIKSFQGIGDTTKIFYTIRKTLNLKSIENPIIAECRKVNKTGPPNAINTCTENISRKFFIDGYPTNILIDKNGIITHIYYNLLDSNDYRNLKVELDKRLGSK